MFVELSVLFAVEHGNKFDLNKMDECDSGNDGAIPFVGRSGVRNGIVAFVKKTVAAEPLDAGLITVALGGRALSSFVQPRPFYTAQNIDILRPIIDMSLDAKLYYCLCIEANRFRYSTFGREANRTLKSILVPSFDNLPEWVDGSIERAIVDLRSNLAAVASS